MSRFPIGIDDNDTLYAPLFNRAVGVLVSEVPLSGSSVVIDFPFKLHNSSLSEILPLFLVFEEDEIWLIKDIARCSYQLSGSNHRYTFGIAYSERPYGGPMRVHLVNEKAYITLVSAHWKAYKEAIEKLQKYGIRVAASAPSSPQVGEAYLNTTDGRIYVCFTAGTWTAASFHSHNDLSNRHETDPHPQYMGTVNSNFNNWHTALGGVHVEGGDQHSHWNYPIRRIRSGNSASRGSPTCVGDFYYDTEQDKLFVSANGSTWQEFSSVPSGAIAIFTTSCPPGWSYYNTLHGRFVKAGNYQVGGSTSGHSHSITAVPAHYHSFSRSATTSSTGTHRHDSSVYEESTTLYNAGGHEFMNPEVTKLTASGGSHTHTVTVPSQTTSVVGDATVYTSTDYAEPPNANVIFCKKD